MMSVTAAIMLSILSLCGGFVLGLLWELILNVTKFLDRIKNLCYIKNHEDKNFKRGLRCPQSLTRQVRSYSYLLKR